MGGTSMKKILCLALSCLTALALFTGCSGTMYTDYGYNRAGSRGAYDYNGSGNVSTSRDGTVNGGENTFRRNSPRAKTDGKMDFGK